jgi:hypothetical protein
LNSEAMFFLCIFTTCEADGVAVRLGAMVLCV